MLAKTLVSLGCPNPPASKAITSKARPCFLDRSGASAVVGFRFFEVSRNPAPSGAANSGRGSNPTRCASRKALREFQA